MPNLHRYGRGTRASAPTRWFRRGGGVHARPRRIPRPIWGALTGAMLTAPGVYLVAEYGAGTAPLSYLTGVVLGVAARSVAVLGRRR